MNIQDWFQDWFPANLGGAGDPAPLCWDDPLEKEIATHSSILAWEIPWIEDTSWGHKRAGHDLVTEQQGAADMFT